MKKFEYCTLTREFFKNKDGTYEEIRGSILNVYGKAGWELVSTESFDEHVVRIATDYEEVKKEDGEIDYVDNGKKFLMEYDRKKVVYFFKKEKIED